MTPRPRGERPGSGFPAGDHVALALTCPKRHPIVTFGQDLTGGPVWTVRPANAHRSWVDYDGDTAATTTRVRLFCGTCGTDEPIRVADLATLLGRLRHAGQPREVPLTVRGFHEALRRTTPEHGRHALG